MLKRTGRVLHVLSGGGLGGVETFVRTATSNLDRSQFEHEACILGTTGPLVDALRAGGVETTVLQIRSGAARLRSVATLTAFLVPRRFDIVHVNCGRAWLRRVFRLCGARHVLSHVHGFPDDWAVAVREGRLLPLVRTYGAAATQVLACSNWVASILRPCMPAIVLRYGVELPPADRATRRHSSGDVVAGFIGRLVPQKGLPYLFEAMAMAMKKCSQLRLVVVGDGSLRAEVNRLAASLPPGRCRLLGAQTDVYSILREIDFVVMPSEWEAFGIAALEAQAFRRPVVAFQIDGLPEAVADGETGILVPHRDTAALADAVLRLAGDAQLRWRMGEAGRQRVEQLFSADVMARQLGAVYQQLMKGPLGDDE